MGASIISKKLVYWSPRILSIAFALVLSLFALDVFADYSGWQAVAAFLIHLLPSLALVAVILIAWKREWIGAVIFFAAAVFYVYEAGFGRPWTWYAFISGPAFIVAVLFLMSWLQERRRL